MNTNVKSYRFRVHVSFTRDANPVAFVPSVLKYNSHEIKI